MLGHQHPSWTHIKKPRYCQEFWWIKAAWTFSISATISKLWISISHSFFSITIDSKPTFCLNNYLSSNKTNSLSLLVPRLFFFKKNYKLRLQFSHSCTQWWPTTKMKGEGRGEESLPRDAYVIEKYTDYIYTCICILLFI